jgi:hypothetical protein
MRKNKTLGQNVQNVVNITAKLIAPVYKNTTHNKKAPQPIVAFMTFIHNMQHTKLAAYAIKIYRP